MKFFKGFFKGLLYVILSPLIIVGFACYTVYAVFLYIWEFIMAAVKFFSGSKLTTDLKEDKKLKEYIQSKKEVIENAQQPQQNVAQNQPQGDTIINNFYITPEQYQQMSNQQIQNPTYPQVEQQEQTNYGDYYGGDNNE